MRCALAGWLLAWGGVGLSGCLPFGDPCCHGDAECADGMSCFEGRCARRCDDTVAHPDAQCDEGERCVEDAGVCRATDSDSERCPYPVRDGAP